MNNALELLFLRRPPIDYISPPICEALFSSSGGPVIVLNPLEGQTFPTGLVLGGVGGFMLSWDSYPGALCYSVYKSNTDDPFGGYHIVAECIPNPPIDLSPFGGGFYRVSAITPNGETPLSPPVHFAGSIHCPSIIGTPNPPVRIVQVGEEVVLGPITVDEGSGGIVTYQWYKDNVLYADTSNTTKDTLVIPTAALTDSGVFKLHVGIQNVPECGSVSDPVELVVGLNAYWNFGGTFNDAINGVAFAPTGGTTGFAAGKITLGASIHVNNGQNGGLETGYVVPTRYQGSSITIWGWINFGSASNLTLSGWDHVSQFGGNDDTAIEIFRYSDTGDATIAMSNFTFSETATISTNITQGWHFVVMWYDPADFQFRAQIDGGPVLLGDFPVHTLATTVANFSLIVQGIFAATTTLFDEIGILNGTVLSDNVRSFLYNAGSGRTNPF